MINLEKYPELEGILGKVCEIRGYDGGYEISGTGTITLREGLLTVNIPNAKVSISGDVQNKPSVEDYIYDGISGINSSYTYEGSVHLSFAFTNLSLDFKPI